MSKYVISSKPIGVIDLFEELFDNSASWIIVKGFD